MSDQDFKEWASKINNPGGPSVDPIPLPSDNDTRGIAKNTMETDLQKLLREAMSTPDSKQYAYKTADLSDRYKATFKGIDNEELYAQNQDWSSKMVNGVGKGLVLTGTTLLQSTLGLVNGVTKALQDGKFSSFYDNDFNRSLDEINKRFENILPNYYTQEEKNANWYSPSKLMSANFLWDGIVKNLGFAAGASISGMGFAAGLAGISKGLASMGGAARLLSVGKTAETIAAIEGGLLTAEKAASTYGKIKSLSDTFLTSYKSLNFGQRAIVAGLATTGEAGFEAYHNLNEFRNQKIEEYKRTHLGMAPEGEELEKINRAAEAVGDATFKLNVGLLTATNYIQFPRILGASYRAEKGIVNSLTTKIDDITKDTAGQYIKTPERFGKVLSTINKARPYLFSASEGFEEGAQYAIGVGVKDYYDKKNKSGANDFINSLREGIAQTLTTNEGMENVLIGGLSGSLMQARSTYNENKQLAKDTTAALSDFNKYTFTNFVKDTTDSINRGTTLQEERERAIRQGDVLESKDIEADYVINYLTPRIKYGRFDLVKADIEDHKKLAATDEGFAQLQAEGKAYASDTREQFLQRINNFEQTAENVKSLYQSLNLRYGGLMKDGKPVYAPEVLDKMVYAATKVADYDKRIPQLSAQLLTTGIDVTSIVDDILKSESDSYNSAIETIEKSNPIVKDDLIQALQDITEISLRRDKFLKEYEQIKTSPKQFEEVKAEPAPEVKPGEPAKTIKVKTRKGDEELEIGTEYYAGRRVEVEEGGTIDKFSRFTIVGESEDGLSLKLFVPETNNHIFVKKSAFENYKFGKVSSVEKKENAKFYMEVADHIFTYNFGKGSKKEGTLTYDPDTDRLFFKSLDGKYNKQVTRDQFQAKPGYDVAQIYSNKTFTPKAQAAVDAKVSIEEKLATRNRIVADLYESSKKRMDEINSTLEANKKKLESIEESLDNLSKTKAGLPRKKFSKAVVKTINELSKLRETIERQNAELELEKEELEATLPYLQDLVSNVGELEGNGKELMASLKEDINTLEELISHTNDAIKQGNSIIDSIDSALRTALSIYDDFVKRLTEENPNVPLA